jgi:hypothetical protein
MTWQKYTDWLYLPQGQLPLISRLVGLISLPIGFIIWFFTHSGCDNGPYPQPFNVPAFLIGDHLVQLPLPPEPVNICIFVLFAVAAVMLIAGKSYRVLYIYMATTVAYFSARDFLVCCFHWVLLDFCFLVALSFQAKNKNEPSTSRRLVQLTISFCYLFGVLQKVFYPDFWQGLTFEAYFYDGYAVAAPFRAFVINHPLPMTFWCASAIFLLAAETFIGLGLFFRRTRIAACILGFVLHGGIILIMDPILALFSIEMWTGYLAFFDGKGAVAKTRSDSAALPELPGPTAPTEATESTEPAAPTKPTEPKKNGVETALSLAFIALMILMPLRIYYLPGPSAELLTLFDRTPWTFGMFILRQKVETIEIVFDDDKGQTHILPVTGRMQTASNANELISIARYVLQNNPTATSIRINDLIVVNERRRILKTLIWENPTAPGSAAKISVTSAGDYCRGAANRSPVDAHRP